MNQAQRFVIVRCPPDLALTNKLIFNEYDCLKRFGSDCYVLVQNRYFGVAFHSDVKTGSVGLSGIQRSWLDLSEGTFVDVKKVDKPKNFINSMTLEVDFLVKRNATPEGYDTDVMKKQFLNDFNEIPFYYGQEIVLKYEKLPHVKLRVKELSFYDSKQHHAIITQNTGIMFEKVDDSIMKLTGKSKGKSSMPNIINPDWNFSQMGIGGLDDEFSAIFRRAFASRVFPPELIEDLGMQHVKGILLYGPPGTGKTLMARQIGKMLNAREPKIVNGPEILNKFVGESEANIRKLFEDAEKDQKNLGSSSGLHMIIFDEIDAICKQRGTASGSTGVADTVVNQLLSKVNIFILLLNLFNAYYNLKKAFTKFIKSKPSVNLKRLKLKR